MPAARSLSGNDGSCSPAGLSEWARAVKENLDSGMTVEFSPKGFSMWPTLRPKKDTVCIQTSVAYSVMDIVLAVSDNPNGVFLHRIVRVERGRYILMGDSNLYQAESCSPQGILGKLVCVRRNGRDVTNSFSNRLFRLPHRAPPSLRRLFVRIINLTR